MTNWEDFIIGEAAQPPQNPLFAIPAVQVPTAPPFDFPWINVKEEGASGDGVADDALAIQAALDKAANTGGNVVFFPAGVYLVGSQLDIDQNVPVHLMGAGQNATFVAVTSTTANLFNVNQVAPTIFENMTITRTVTPTAGAGIVLTDGTTENTGSTIIDCIISNHYIEIDIVRANRYKVINCYLADHYIMGMRIQNTYNGDSGDGTLIGNVIDTSRGGTTYGIAHYSGGGLRMIGNKILSHSFGYNLLLSDGVFTGILLMVGNSIEGQSTRCVQISDSSASTGGYSHMTFVGNEFAGPSVTMEFAGGILVANLVTIVGNTFSLGASGTPTAISLSRVNKITIDTNIIVANGGTGPIGIAAGSNVTNIHYGGGNQFTGFAAGDKIANSASSYTFEASIQSGTESFSSSTAYGDHFTGTTSLSFPVAFDANFPIDLVVTPLGGAGGIVGAGYDGGSVTTTGATLRAYSLNSDTVNVAWVAHGFIG